MAQTPFGSVAGARLTDTGTPIDRGYVLKTGWTQEEVLEVPTIPIRVRTWMTDISDKLVDLAPPLPDSNWTVQYYDTTGDGKGDTIMVGWRWRF